jgi:hypothetical protein
MSEPYDLPGVLAGTGRAAEPVAAPDRTEAADHLDRPEGPEPYRPTAPAEPEPEPEPLGVALGETGNADVDAAVERLRDADELPVHAHIEVYEDVHRGLRDALSALDENRG